MKLSVLVPVYNEEATILELLDRVQAAPEDKEIIVVDDCSTDGSRALLSNLNRPGVKVVFHDRNRGKGAGIRTALAHATGDYVVVQDADLEYDPEEYPKLLAPIRAGQAEVVYGSRFMGRLRQMTLGQKVGNKFLTVVTNLLYRTTLTDMETCYKVIPTGLIKAITLRANAFDFEPEITAKLLKRGCRILEVPITYAAREVSEGKKISWRDGFPALWSLIKYRFVD